MFYPIVGGDNQVTFAAGSTISQETGEPVFLDAGASVTFRVQDEAGVDLAGETWPQTARYIANSQGLFLAVLRDTVALEPHVECWFVAEVDYGPDARRPWRIRMHPLPGEDETS